MVGFANRDIANRSAFLLDVVRHNRLGENADIEDFHALPFQLGAMSSKRGLLLRGEFAEGEIVDVVRIRGDVVKLFKRFAGSGVAELSDGQGVGVLPGVAGDFASNLGKIGEDAGLIPGEMWEVITDVEVVFAADGAGAVEDFVNTVAKAVDVVGGLLRLLSEKDFTLHVVGRRETGKTEDGLRKIDEGDEAVERLAGLRGREVLIFFGKADHERDFHPGVMEESLVARHSGAVIGVEEDDGVFSKAIIFEFRENAADLLVHRGDTVIVAGDCFTNRFRVRVVGWNRGFVRIVDLSRGEV